MLVFVQVLYSLLYYWPVVAVYAASHLSEYEYVVVIVILIIFQPSLYIPAMDIILR